MVASESKPASSVRAQHHALQRSPSMRDSSSLGVMPALSASHFKEVRRNSLACDLTARTLGVR